MFVGIDDLDREGAAQCRTAERPGGISGICSARTVTRVGERRWAVLEPADVAHKTVGEGDDLPSVDAPVGVIGGGIGGHGHADGHAVPDGGDLRDRGTHSSVKTAQVSLHDLAAVSAAGFGSPGAPHATSGRAGR